MGLVSHTGCVPPDVARRNNPELYSSKYSRPDYRNERNFYDYVTEIQAEFTCRTNAVRRRLRFPSKNFFASIGFTLQIAVRPDRDFSRSTFITTEASHT